MRKSLLILIIIASFSGLRSTAQVNLKDSCITVPILYGSYSYLWPGGDLNERFGGTSSLGPGFMVKTSSNWIIGAELDFIFGGNVKNGFEILGELINEDGNITNGDGVPAVVALYERGFTTIARFGKLFPVFNSNPNSGIVAMVGLGYMQHKIFIDVENESAPQLQGDYKRGYDRLSGGFSLNQYIGYFYLGNSRILNFSVGIEFYQAWTKNQREYVFDLRGPDKEKRFDMMFGPKIMWMIPMHKRSPQEFYYN